MDGLKEQFGADIDFLVLDIDDPATLPLREQYNMVQRTNYVLVNERGEVVQRWYGPLNEREMSAALSSYLRSRGS